MKLPSLVKATAIRLTLRYIFIYTLVMGLAVVSLSLLTGHLVGADIKKNLKKQLSTIESTYAKSGIEATKAKVAALAGASAQKLFYLLISREGRVISGNLKGWPREASIRLNGDVQNIWLEDNVIPLKLDDDEVYWPVIATEFMDGTRLLIAHSVQQIKELHELTEFLLQTLGVAIVLSLLLGINLSRAILRRIKLISYTANGIMQGDLRQRILVSDRSDEFDDLARQLNAMLDKIQRLILGIREVTDNVAHDLRSPLTRLRNRLEITLLEQRSQSEYRKVIGQAVKDTEALIDTFNSLLRIAQVESGNHRELWTQFDLKRLVTDLADIYRPLVEDKNQSLETLCRTPIALFANADLIAQMLSNLLDNAIKYTPENGSIGIEVTRTELAVEITLRDSGPGIPHAEREHVLKRFVRLDNSRNTPGNGLGLSLVQATCRLHNAELILEDARPGLCVKILFPKQPLHNSGRP